MGKIFGISNLPVSTIMTPFENVNVTVPCCSFKYLRRAANVSYNSKPFATHSNPVIRKRYGIGKLLSAFPYKSKPGNV